MITGEFTVTITGPQGLALVMTMDAGLRCCLLYTSDAADEQCMV